MGLEAYRRKVSEAKHLSILDAARETFLDCGFSRAAMADIAQKADVSTATLYKHFESKEALFLAIITDAIEQFGDEMPTNLANMSAEDALKQAANHYLKAQYEGRINALLRVVIGESATNPELGDLYYKQGVIQRNEELADLLKQLSNQGKIKIDNPLRAARQILGLVKEELIWPAMFNPKHDPKADADEAISEAVKTFLARYGA